MNIKTKFDVGNTVYFITEKTNRKRCKTCGHHLESVFYIESDVVESISTKTERRYSGSGGCLGEYTETEYNLMEWGVNFEHNLCKTQKEAQAKMEEYKKTREISKKLNI